MRLSQYKPKDDGPLARFVREARALLTANEVGLRWSDNIGPVVVAQFNSDDLPITYPVPGLSAEPAAVVLLKSRRLDGTNPDRRLGGLPVEWRWRAGEVEVTGIAGVVGSVDYEITLGVLRGD